ncbi:MAG: hypothetical protein Kow0032_13280 [Methyloligellaceae bacterium]
MSIRRTALCSPLPLLAAALAVSLLIALPQQARSGGYSAGAPAQPGPPRWSNRHHLETPQAPADLPECGGPVPSAHYVPGVDAWGRPVAPAEGYRSGPKPSLPVELDVHLKRKRVGRKSVDVTSGPVTYDAANNTINGYPITRDCAPSVK